MASKKFGDLSLQQQGLLLACLPVVLAAAIYYEMVMPLSQQADLIKRIAEAQKQLDTLRQIVPDQPAEDQFVKMIYGTAASSQIRIRSLVEQPPVRQMYDTAMPFALRLDGAYYGMLDFFNRLANSARIVNVSSLALGSPGGPGGKGSYQVSPDETVGANCVLTTFYNSPPPPPPVRRGPLRR